MQISKLPSRLVGGCEIVCMQAGCYDLSTAQRGGNCVEHGRVLQPGSEYR